MAPQVDPATWSLKVTGMVDHPFELSYDDLLQMPQIEETVTLSCVSNEVGGDLVGNARWQGVRARPICSTGPACSPAPPRSSASSIDGFTGGFPTGARPPTAGSPCSPSA